MSNLPGQGEGSMSPPAGHVAAINEPSQRVVELAARYMDRVARGEEPDLEVTAGALPDELLRDQFRRLIGDARTVQELLPVQVRPGTILSGRYRVGVQIGSGGMGRVYEAYDRQLERVVALKVLAMPAASSFDAHKQFRQEAVLLAGLQHPNIVAVHEIACEGDVNYIVMDLVKGRPLDEVVEAARGRVKSARTSAGRSSGLMREVLGPASDAEGPGPADETDWHRAVARIVREAACTVEAAHAAGVVHRDIKPKNILLRRNGMPVLLDFGLAGACECDEAEKTKGLFGTTSYLAPEQVLSGHVGNDPRSDVYQLGVLLHELLTLERAFTGTGPSELIKLISNGDCRRPRDADRSVPVDLEAICLRAMELDVGRRYLSARQLREDIDCWLGGVKPPIALHGGRLLRLVHGSRYAIRRHKVAAVAAAALLIGAAAGGFAWLGSAGRDAVRIRPYQTFADGRPPAYDDQVVEVTKGDQLGVIIDTAEPVYVYALSIYGQRNPPTWIKPMAVQLVGFTPAGGDGEAPAFHPFGGTSASSIWVPPGRTTILCSLIDAVDPADPYEGLWIFTSRRPHESLEAWIDVLDLQAQSTASGVDYETARSLFAGVAAGTTGSVTRGSSPAPLSKQQAQSLSASLNAAMLLGESEWPYDDPQRWSRMWPVSR